MLALLLLTSIRLTTAQDSNTKKRKLHGSFYLTWGYHRDFYSKSTIHFQDKQTDEYDFRIYKAKAHDQLDIHSDFFREEITIPQYVFYGGYFFGNKGDWGVEVGWDHLKYVVTDEQTVRLKGTIQGKYYDTDTTISRPFLHLEHTNGNNYLMANLVKRNNLFTRRHHTLSGIFKGGGGILFPKTESWILNHHNDGPFRPSGVVIGAAAGFRYEILRFFFLEPSIKGAFAQYTGAKLYNAGRAQHNFFSVQFIAAFGFNVPLSGQ